MSQQQAGHKISSFSSFRISLFVFFLLYTYVTAIGLIPLPDQPPRIDFWGVFCIAGGMCMAFYSLTNSLRIFLFSSWAFIPIAISQLEDKKRFLETMLEPYYVQQVTIYALYGVLVLLISPLAFRTFNQPYSSYQPPRKLLLQKGVRY